MAEEKPETVLPKTGKRTGPGTEKTARSPEASVSFRKTEAGNIKPEMYGTQDGFPAACDTGDIGKFRCCG